ncbi:MAG: hypothetical protein WCY05_08325, partial [Candidatus Omnitrophota bacterium]
IIKYITPLFLIFILGFWFFQQALPCFLLKGVPKENVPFILATRLGFVGVFLLIVFLVRKAHRAKLKGQKR